MFTCSGDNQMIISTCGSDGQWNPDPEMFFMCPTIGELCLQTACLWFLTV